MNEHESSWTREVMRQMQLLGCCTVTLSASRRQQNGVPDRWVAGPKNFGFACWLEFKGRRTPIRGDQRLLLRNIRARAPHAAYVVRYPGQVTDEAGTLLAEFDGTGRDLMEALKLLCQKPSATT